jgi:DNA-binding response OmpR family regulator
MDPTQAPAADTAPHPMLRSGNLEIDLHAPTVLIHRGRETLRVDLPVTEHRLIAFLLQTPGHARSREEICKGVWPTGHVDVRTVDQYVRRLRRSLQRVGADAMVQTLNRYGYRIEPALLPATGPSSGPSHSPARSGAVTAPSHAVSTVNPFLPNPSHDRS